MTLITNMTDSEPYK